jgi:hypothetical protein
VDGHGGCVVVIPINRQPVHHWPTESQTTLFDKSTQRQTADRQDTKARPTAGRPAGDWGRTAGLRLSFPEPLLSPPCFLVWSPVSACSYTYSSLRVRAVSHHGWSSTVIIFSKSRVHPGQVLSTLRGSNLDADEGGRCGAGGGKRHSVQAMEDRRGRSVAASWIAGHSHRVGAVSG